MNTKLIVFDLDGTLLKDDKSISYYTLSIIEKCKQQGMKIAIATARSEKAGERYIELVKPNIIISNGGALVKYNDKIIYKSLLTAQTSDRLIDECVHSPAVSIITVETETAYYVSYQNQSFNSDYEHAVYHDFSKPLFQDTYKITVEIADNDIAFNIANKFSECKMIAFSGENWYRFANKQANKITAINSTIKALDMQLSQVISFGDDYNDIDMIAKCGIGVAMGNAIDDVKAVADYVCDTNENDGVAKWINKFVL